MKVLGLGLIGIAVAIFYGVFFCFAPFVANTIPVGEWQHFIQIVSVCSLWVCYISYLFL